MRESVGCKGKDRIIKINTRYGMHSDTVLDQCGKCFWRILIDFVSGVGDDMQMGLRQECVQLFRGFKVCTILFSTDDGHRTVEFGKLRAEIKHAHGMR